jgi:hypothetical protein
MDTHDKIMLICESTKLLPAATAIASILTTDSIVQIPVVYSDKLFDEERTPFIDSLCMTRTLYLVVESIETPIVTKILTTIKQYICKEQQMFIYQTSNKTMINVISILEDEMSKNDTLEAIWNSTAKTEINDSEYAPKYIGEVRFLNSTIIFLLTEEQWPNWFHKIMMHLFFGAVWIRY